MFVKLPDCVLTRREWDYAGAASEANGRLDSDDGVVIGGADNRAIGLRAKRHRHHVCSH